MRFKWGYTIKNGNEMEATYNFPEAQDDQNFSKLIV
jgi:hypothetical protein